MKDLLQQKNDSWRECLLHLKMQEVNTKENFEVVISDSSGEVYRDYISNNELIGRDKAIAQADKLLLFVDSTKLYNRSYRSFADDYTSLMRRLKENSKLPSHAIVYLIFNKIDLKDEKINLVLIMKKQSRR